VGELKQALAFHRAFLYLITLFHIEAAKGCSIAELNLAIDSFSIGRVIQAVGLTAASKLLYLRLSRQHLSEDYPVLAGPNILPICNFLLFSPFVLLCRFFFAAAYVV